MSINSSTNASERKTKYEKMNVKTLCYALDKDMKKRVIVYTFDNGRIKFPEKQS